MPSSPLRRSSPLVHDAAEGKWFRVQLHRTAQGNRAVIYQEDGPGDVWTVGRVTIPYQTADALGNPQRLTITVRAGTAEASTVRMIEP